MEMFGLGNSTFDCTHGGVMRRTEIVDTNRKIEALRPKMTKPVILVGLMGAGKTKMGRLLADALGVPFTDADDVIVARAGLSIPEIFETYGEARFRALEADVIADLMTQGGGIISTGGGAVMTPRSADLIFSNRAISIWMTAPLDVHVARTGRHGGRPLLREGNPAEKLAALLAERAPVYARAKIVIENGDQDARVTLERMIDALYTYSQQEDDDEHIAR